MYGVEQMFARSDDAYRYASGVAGSSVTRHVLRKSVDEAVVVFDRRIVVADGVKRSDLTVPVRQFVDDPRFMPGAADVEWFCCEGGGEWHIAGFGTDEAELDAKMLSVVDRACRLSRNPRAGIA